MKSTVYIAFLVFYCFFSQNLNAQTKSDTLLAELSKSSCECIEKIKTDEKDKKEIITEIVSCIDQNAQALQMGEKMIAVAKDVKEGKIKEKEINININPNKNSPEYQKYYTKLEKHLIENCPELRRKIATSDKTNKKSVSENPKAIEAYNEGLTQMSSKNFKKAIENFKKALKIDQNFAFAWDNIGVCHRQMNEYDEAIKAYKNSLKIDPKGKMPMQNMAVAYELKKDYKQAINTYQNMAKLDKDNPESYFGLGRIYLIGFNDSEKGLDNICKAYVLYNQQQSPYKDDAQKLINSIFQQMKQDKKEKVFNDILKKNKIDVQKE